MDFSFYCERKLVLLIMTIYWFLPFLWHRRAGELNSRLNNHPLTDKVKLTTIYSVSIWHTGILHHIGSHWSLTDARLHYSNLHFFIFSLWSDALNHFVLTLTICLCIFLEWLITNIAVNCVKLVIKEHNCRPFRKDWEGRIIPI